MLPLFATLGLTATAVAMTAELLANDLRALTFDVFGTAVDWRSGVAREAAAVLGPSGRDLDWGAFADAWRAKYVPAMARVISGERPWTILDELHRENLLEVLREVGVGDLDPGVVDDLNRAWWRLDPWPDVREGLARLKRRFILATLSNGNVALMVDMARRAGLPWDVILGAEVARAYKPSPEAYDRAAGMLGLSPAQCLMVAAHPDDLTAAAGRGFRTAYVHRPLEFGSAGAGRARPTGPFDIAADSFVELAERLGC
jgi:2-haloacid dehalogenase